MIKVMASYADQSGCGDYRVRFPAAAVNASDLGVSVQTVGSFNCDATFQDNRYHIRHVAIPGDVSVVSVQRPMSAAMAGLVAWLKARRPDIGVVVELDDDLLALNANHMSFAGLQASANAAENIQWLRKTVALADVVTVSTPELAKTYGGPMRPAFIIRNGVPAAMLKQPSRTIDRRGRGANSGIHVGDRIIGWAGAVGTHPGDLDVTSGALADIIGDGPRAASVVFRNVGPKDGVAKGLGLDEEQVEASGWLSPELYRLALGELDIGIVPLADNKFNRSKSALKALEMGAVGVPVVASSLPEFEELSKTGMPIWLAKDRRRHWSGALNRALSMSDGELRELGQSTREYVRRNATVEIRAKKWADAWKTAAQIARTRVRSR